MLILTRTAGTGDKATLTIGEGVEVVVLEVSGESVRLGVTAPRETQVHRREVWLLRQAEAAGNGNEAG